MEAPEDRPECPSDDLYTALRMCGYTGPVDYYGRANSGDPVRNAMWNLRAVQRIMRERA